MPFQSSTQSTLANQNHPAQPDMSVVLVCWNNIDYLGPCLDSLFNANLQCNYDVVVVDNGSTDGSQKMLQEKYPQVMLIQNERNVGLGRASNQGIEATTGKYVLLLNNDTIVDGPSLDAMIDILNTHPNGGAAGGRLLNPDGSFQSGYNHFSTLFEEFLIATRFGELIWPGYPGHYDDDQPPEAIWITSACLMVRRSALNQVGLLDEGYFIYGDEVDLQYRLIRAGWKVYFIPSANTIHYGGRSMDRWRRRKMVYRGKIIFYKKHYGVLKTQILRIMLGILSLFKMFYWGIISIFLSQRDIAKKEIRSNLEVIRVCINPA